jgi:1-deoxy-D-xylulose-5-phosphate reductoisomerase
VKGLVVLGSTGSVGVQTLDIVRAFPDEFRVVGLAARRSFLPLRTQIEEFQPKYVSFEGTDDERAEFASNGRVICSMEEMVAFPDVDLVVSATVGDAALVPTIAAIKAGKEIVLVNKEAIIMAGPILMELARKHDVELRPADSEPNAIWQCIRGEDKSVSKLIITASGGAFRDYDIDMLDQVTPAQALKHPTWDMGPKITVDSATLMNKALEVIEARWLFDMHWGDIEVVIHPQSLIHSMVEFVDGSVKAQISPPDMRLPIQYSMLYPKRLPNAAIQRFDAVAAGELTFKPLDPGRYPCFELALDVAKRGGTWPAALNGADEMAVAAFLGGKIKFTDIPVVIEKALHSFTSVDDPTIDDIIAASTSAKKRVAQIAGM